MQSFAAVKNTVTGFFSSVYEYIDDTLFSKGKGQSIVLSQLAEFLKLTAPDSDISKELQKAFQGGHCEGLSRIHGPMGIVKKLRWWEAALVEVALWDKNIASLDTPVLLPEAEDDKAVPLREIFVRVLNYIVTTHLDASVVSEFRIKNIDNLNIYKRNNFEISAGEKHYKICKSVTLSGYFSKQHLQQLLNEDYLTNATCMVMSDDHSIRIGYLGNEQWLIYNPNYSHDRRGPIHKIMSKDKMLDELLRIQNHSLTLQIAHLKLPKAKNIPYQYYSMLLDKHLPELLQGHGLHHIILRTPQHIPLILKKVEKDKQVLAAIVDALTNIPEKILDAGEYVVVLPACLRLMVQRCSEYWDDFVKIIKTTEEGRVALETAYADFSVPDDRGYTVLTQTALFNAEYLPKLLQEFEKIGDVGAKVVAVSLDVKHKRSKEPGLLLIEEFAPDAVPKVLELAMKSADGYKHLCNALLMKNNVEYEEKIEFKPEKNKRIKNIFDDKHKRNRKKKKAKQKREKYSKKVIMTVEHQSCFEQLVESNSKNLAVVMKALYDDQVFLIDESPELFLLLAKHQPLHFEKHISLMEKNEYSKQKLCQFLKESPRKHVDQTESGLYLLNLHGREFLPRILNSLSCADMTNYGFLTMLMTKVHGKTCFEHIIEHPDKKSLPIILDSISRIFATQRDYSPFYTDILQSFGVLVAGLVVTITASQYSASDNVLLKFLTKMTEFSGVGLSVASILVGGLGMFNLRNAHREINESGEVRRQLACYKANAPIARIGAGI